MSTLHQAITRRNTRQVRLLTSVGCNVNRLDASMRTPMRLVCDIGNEHLGVSLGCLLLENGAEVHHKDEFGISVFCYACTKQRTRLVECMIREREIAWLDKDYNGNTALHHAVQTGNYLITQMIIEQMRKYALNTDHRNKRGETPLILAERLGHYQCAELLRYSGKASTAARDDLVFKNADEWRQIRVERVPRKLSPYFSNKFPEVAKQLTTTVDIKRPQTIHQEIKPFHKPNKQTLPSGQSVKNESLPRLLEMHREQQMDTFRASAKPQNNTDQNTKEHQEWSEDEMKRVRSDQVTMKRKAFSFTGLPVLAQQRFFSTKKQNQAAQNASISKDVGEPNTAKKLLIRRCTSDVTSAMANMAEAAREKGLARLGYRVHEENTDQ